MWNGARTLPRALDGLLAQTFRDIRILISDNASEDETPEICHAYAREDSRVEVHRQSMNIGMMPNFGWLTEHAASPYFMWASHDDVCQPRSVELLRSAMERDAGAQLAVPAIERIDPSGGSEILRYGTPGSSGERIPGSRLRAAMQLAAATPRHLYIYGLWRLPFLRLAWRRYPTVAAHDRLFITQVVLATPVIYVDQPLLRRYVQPVHVAERYRDEAVGRAWSSSRPRARLVIATVPYLLRSEVVPLCMKPFAVIVALRYALTVSSHAQVFINLVRRSLRRFWRTDGV